MKFYKIISKHRYGHGFEIGSIVIYMRTYEDGTLVLKGRTKFSRRLVIQDIHPMDCVFYKETKETKET